MFEIEYKGGNSVVISSKSASIVIDPVRSIFGLDDIFIKDSIEIATESDFSAGNTDARVLIEGPGEYETAEFSILGISVDQYGDKLTNNKKSTIYRIIIGEIRIGVIGNIAPAITTDQLESFGLIDVLILPIGGGSYTLDAKLASTVVRQIDPKVVIPTHYADASIDYPIEQDGIDEFIKELNVSVETVNKYKIKSQMNIPSSLTIIELTRTN